MSCLASEIQPSLSPVQERVILALAAGSTVTAAAKRSGVHRTTIYTWLQDNTFADGFELARLQFRNTLQDQLQELTATAFDTIRQLLASPTTPPSVRLRAALAVLNHKNWTLPDPVPDIRLPAEALAKPGLPAEASAKEQNSTKSDTPAELAPPPATLARNDPPQPRPNADSVPAPPVVVAPASNWIAPPATAPAPDILELLPS